MKSKRYNYKTNTNLAIFKRGMQYKQRSSEWKWQRRSTSICVCTIYLYKCLRQIQIHGENDENFTLISLIGTQYNDNLVWTHNITLVSFHSPMFELNLPHSLSRFFFLCAAPLPKINSHTQSNTHTHTHIHTNL